MLLADDIAKLEIDNYNIYISFQSEEQGKVEYILNQQTKPHHINQ